MGRRANVTVAFTAVLWGLLPQRSPRAGPPLISNDTDTPGDGRWEVNAYARTTWARHSYEVEAPTVDANYGLRERGQLTVEVPVRFA